MDIGTERSLLEIIDRALGELPRSPTLRRADAVNALLDARLRLHEFATLDALALAPGTAAAVRRSRLHRKLTGGDDGKEDGGKEPVGTLLG
jgi:hypothetical protein